MGMLQQRIAPPVERQLAVIATAAANLKAQFRELETLRDQVRKAQNRPLGRGAPHSADKAARPPR
jgi:hypothetical protein